MYSKHYVKPVTHCVFDGDRLSGLSFFSSFFSCFCVGSKYFVTNCKGNESIFTASSISIYYSGLQMMNEPARVHG